MELSKRLIIKFYRNLMNDAMRRNSMLLILAQLTSAAGLFFFWIINARLFSASSVGLATSFINFGILVAAFTNLGLPNTIIRFLQKSKKPGGLFTTSLSLITFSSFIGGLVALKLLPHLAPKLGFVTASAGLEILLVLLIMTTAIGALLDGTLISFRKGELVLVKSIITLLPRLILPFFALEAGVRGMTGIYIMTLLLGVGYNLIIIVGRLMPKESLKPVLGLVVEHKSYATSNYLGGLFGVLPVTVVPIIVLNRLGPESAAYFYMPMMIAAMISLICNAISQTLISECSHTDDLDVQRAHFKNALKHQYQLLIPLIAALIIAGWPILSIYGHLYAANGFIPLVIMVLAGLLVGLNWLGDTWLNITKRSRDYFLMNAFNAIATLSSVYLFSKHGLVAVAIGWLVGQLISAVVYLAIFARNQLFNFKR